MKALIPTICLLLIGVGLFFVFKPEQLGNTAGILSTKQAGEKALAHTNTILSYGPRPPESEGLKNTRAYIKETLTRYGWTVTEQQFSRFTPAGRKEFTNLITRYQGKEYANQDIDLILAAHMDSKDIKEFEFLGADDAASAVGALLVLAENLAKNTAKAKRTEIVFFDGEESFGRGITPKDGLYGSRYYASFWRSESHKPSAGILLDMIGHKNLDIKIPNDSPKPLAELLMRCAKEEGLDQHFGTLRNSIIDDHVPINHAGIPMIDIIGNFGNFSWWHKKEDDGTNLSEESLNKSIRVVSRMIDELLQIEKTSDK